MGKPLGGIRLERNLIHDMQLMVMLSNAKLCWRDLSQPHRDERSIRMPWCAGVVSGKLICSCPMHSNVLVCWRDLVNHIEYREASERLGVPSDLRQADSVVLVARSISAAAQPGRAVDAATRPQDRSYFDRWICLEGCLDLLVRRG